MKRLTTFILLFIILISTFAYADDSLDKDFKAVLLGDYDSGEILYSYNIDQAVEIASISKLMTYLVTMDEISAGRASLDDIVLVSKNAARVNGSSFNLKPGEKVKLSTLLDSILIVSGNDSCIAIAEHVFGSEEKFVNIMNEKAKQIGLESANFLNSNGLPEKEGQNMMNVKDIFKLSRYVIEKYPQILDITKRMELYDESRNFKKENTNPVLDKIPSIDGLKTGYTDLAGYCLVSTVPIQKSENNEKPFRIIGIIMGAKSEEERRDKSIELLNYGINNYSKERIISKDQVIQKIKIHGAIDEEVKVFPSKDLYLLLKKDTKIKREILIDENLNSPMKKGDVVGSIIINIDGNEKEEIDLVIKRDVERANIFMRIFRYIMALVGFID